MSTVPTIQLADCSEFRQTLAARPPRVVHGAAILLLLLVGAAVIWAALVKANLVVKAVGRVRPIEVPTRVFTAASSEVEGRVVEAMCDEGDVVSQGDVLIRLDTARIDNRIAKLERTIDSLNAEINTLSGHETLVVEQHQSAKEKAGAELLQAETSLSRAASQRASEIRKVRAELDASQDNLERAHRLRDSRAITPQELVKLEAEVRQNQEKLVQAELPVDGSQVAIAHRALELVNRDFAVRRSELQTRMVAKQGELESSLKELENLNLQRRESVLRAPIDGVVVSGRVQVGDVLEPGRPVLEIASRRGHRFEATVPSQDVGNLRVGMPVRIKFDAYDYQKYGVLEGTVTYLSPDSRVAPASEQEQALEKVTAHPNAPVAFVVRIEMHGDEVGRGNLRGQVKLGLGGTAEIITDRDSLLMIFVKKIRQTISLG